MTSGRLTGPLIRDLGRREDVLAIVLCGFYFLGLAYPTHLRIVGAYWTETDFYQLYAPDADRIAAGRFPENTYNPPGYPVLLALATRLTGDHFTSGKWLSLMAASLSGLAAFHIFRRLFGARPALLATPIILLSGEFTKYSIEATTDVPFLLLCLAAMLALTHADFGAPRRIALAGALCGLVYLTRYNGVFLLPPFLLGIATLRRPPRDRMKPAALYLLGFLLVVSPWLWLNYMHHGSPIHSTNYRDVATALYGSNDGFASLADVVTREPGRFAVRYLRRVAVTIGMTVGASLAVLPVGPLAAAGIILSLAGRRARSVMLLLLSAAVYILVMALMHWETRYYFFVMVCYAGFAAFAIAETTGWLRRGAPLSPIGARVFVGLIALLILVPSAARAGKRVSRSVSGQAIELIAASRFLRRSTPEGATIMVQKPHLAYLSNRGWLRLSGVGTPEELRTVLRQTPARYLAYDRMGYRLNRGLRVLANPENGIPWLRPIYADAAGALVIYEVEADSR